MTLNAHLLIVHQVTFEEISFPLRPADFVAQIAVFQCAMDLCLPCGSFHSEIKWDKVAFTPGRLWGWTKIQTLEEGRSCP